MKVTPSFISFSSIVDHKNITYKSTGNNILITFLENDIEYLVNLYSTFDGSHEYTGFYKGYSNDQFHKLCDEGSVNCTKINSTKRGYIVLVGLWKELNGETYNWSLFLEKDVE